MKQVNVTLKINMMESGWVHLNLSAKLLASIDEDGCNGCGICVRACASGGFQAIEIDDDIARVDLLKCDGCGLCVGVCPLGVVHMVPRQEMD